MSARSDLREKYAAVEAAVAAHGEAYGAEVRVLCPFCVSSKTGRADRSLGVNLTTGKFWCHRCETKGRLRGYADPDEDNPAPRCLHVSFDKNGNVIGTNAPPERPRVTAPPAYVPLGYGDGAELPDFEPARAYAASRGFTQELATEYEIGACAWGWYAGRIILPCLDENRVWWGFVARDFTGVKANPDGSPRLPYLYPKHMPRGEHLIHEEVLWLPTEEPALVMEGWLDTVPYLGDAAACMGKVSEAQLVKCARANRPVCFVLDGDAWHEAEAHALRLRFEGQRAGFVRLPPKVDPDEVDPAWLRTEARKSLST